MCTHYLNPENPTKLGTNVFRTYKNLHARYFQVILILNSMHQILNNKVSFTTKFVYRFRILDTQLETQLSEQPKRPQLFSF